MCDAGLPSGTDRDVDEGFEKRLINLSIGQFGTSMPLKIDDLVPDSSTSDTFDPLLLKLTEVPPLL